MSNKLITFSLRYMVTFAIIKEKQSKEKGFMDESRKEFEGLN